VVAVLEKIEAELKKRGTKYFCGEEPGKNFIEYRGPLKV
jgi:hypothetical protein